MSTQTVTTEGPRSKRALILRAAIESFGDDGFEHTKWASVADKVGIGQTALYHYFESKVHCLLTIMSSELERSAAAFATAVEGRETPTDELRAAVKAALDVGPREVLQARILQSHMDLLASPRQSKREEAERQHARELVRQVEHNWLDLVERGVASGDFADRDAFQTSHMMLAMILSVWRWYREGGALSNEDVREFTTDAVLRLVRA
jgi:AcrR family transcriptional regulator